MIHKIRATRSRRGSERPIAATLALLALMLALVPLAGCSPQGVTQSATATVAANATLVVSPSPTVTIPNLSITSTVTVVPTQASVPVTATAEITSTSVVTPGESTGVRPTPTGAPPDPLSLLNIFAFYSPSFNLVSRDVVNLDGTGPDEVLFTIAGARHSLTEEVNSAIGVLSYDPVYREWQGTWVSDPISGTASALPSINRKAVGGYNGGNILGDTGPVMALRNTTLDGKAHLYLWRWNKDKKEGEPLKMQGPQGGADLFAAFTADLDVNLADINDDGTYEVVLDNLTGVQIWRWDGNRFIPGGDR